MSFPNHQQKTSARSTCDNPNPNDFAIVYSVQSKSANNANTRIHAFSKPADEVHY